MKRFEDEIVGIGEILIHVNEIKILIKEDRYNNVSIKDLKKDYPEKIIKLEESLLNLMGERDPKILGTEFSGKKWKYLKNLAYPYEDFNSLHYYQKPVNSLKNDNFISKLKTKCPSDEEIERTKENIKLFDIKNGEELTQLYLKERCFITCVCF